MQETPPALYLYGRLLGVGNRVDEAANQFEAALRLDPYFPWAYHGLGTSNAKRDKFGEAVKAYRRALELNPGFTRSMEPLAVCLLRTEQPDEAERWLRRLVELQPEDPQAWFALGKLLYERTRFEDAATAFRKAVDKKNDFAEARRGLGLALLAAGRPKDALALYDDIVKVDPKNGYAIIGRGKALEDLGENHGAADAYQKALEEWTPSMPSKEDLHAKVDALRRLPKSEKRDPQMKSPHEWVQILLNSTEPERTRQAIRVLSQCPGYDEEIYKAFLQSLKNKDGPTRVLAVKELAERYEGMLQELTPLFSFFL